jgi:hypothetical protein
MKTVKRYISDNVWNQVNEVLDASMTERCWDFTITQTWRPNNDVVSDQVCHMIFHVVDEIAEHETRKGTP